MSRERQIEERHELSESIYMSGHGLDWKDSDDIAEQLYNAGYSKQSEVAREIFEEIEDFMIDSTFYKTPVKSMLSSKFAELKKKYTDINQRKEDEGK